MNGHARLLVAALVVGVLGIIAGGVFTLWLDSRETAATCRDLEDVKAALRDDENADWAQLDDNLKLLRIKKTPPLMRRLEAEHDRKLARFAPRPC